MSNEEMNSCPNVFIVSGAPAPLVSMSRGLHYHNFPVVARW